MMNRPTVSRRAFVRNGVLCLGALGSRMLAADPQRKGLVQLGLVTDLHYGDKPAAGTRYYRETLGKLTEAVTAFNAQDLASVVCLGDLIDQAPTVEEEIGWLDTAQKLFATTKAPRRYVLGNHCVGTLTKAEFAEHTGGAREHHYSFDAGGIHFVVLDACYRSDGADYGRKNFDWTDANVPPQQLEWLRADLAATNNSTVIFAHQRLDESGKHMVRNAAAVRAELERSGKVLAVFQGHSHQNDYQQIAGIHYTTLVAMVEGSGIASSGYSVLEVMPDCSLRVRGFRRQVDRDLRKA